MTVATAAKKSPALTTPECRSAIYAVSTRAKSIDFHHEWKMVPLAIIAPGQSVGRRPSFKAGTVDGGAPYALRYQSTASRLGIISLMVPDWQQMMPAWIVAPTLAHGEHCRRLW
jgi:hypothetical protein